MTLLQFLLGLAIFVVLLLASLGGLIVWHVVQVWRSARGCLTMACPSLREPCAPLTSRVRGSSRRGRSATSTYTQVVAVTCVRYAAMGAGLKPCPSTAREPKETGSEASVGV